MPILIRNGSASETVLPAEFADEQQLELLVADHPDLLRSRGEPALRLVARAVDFPEAGTLDLLFVSKDGLPVAVEVRLARNAQARREVAGQVTDYLSALAALSVDDLDALTGGNLEKAVRGLVGDDDDEFDRMWVAIGTNLRAGKSRVVIALDDAPPALERIFRFLVHSSRFDAQLLTIQRYSSGSGEVIVPRDIVIAPGREKPVPLAQLAAVVDAYNSCAGEDLKAVGQGRNYRQVHARAWPPELCTHYEFYQYPDSIGVELHIESARARILSEILKSCSGKKVGQASLEWDPKWDGGRGRLRARFPLSAPAATVAGAMTDLIALTMPPVTAKIKALSTSVEPATHAASAAAAS